MQLAKERKVLTLISRAIIVFLCIYCFCIVASPVAQATTTNTESSTGGLWSVFSGTSILAIGIWFSPLGEWGTEIRKLTADEAFIQNWMQFHTDPASLEKAERALAKIRKEKKALEKKRNRFRLWFYPVIIGVGTGVMTLVSYLHGH